MYGSKITKKSWDKCSFFGTKLRFLGQNRGFLGQSWDKRKMTKLLDVTAFMAIFTRLLSQLAMSCCPKFGTTVRTRLLPER